jgi:hypothetical protein
MIWPIKDARQAAERAEATGLKPDVTGIGAWPQW